MGEKEEEEEDTDKEEEEEEGEEKKGEGRRRCSPQSPPLHRHSIGGQRRLLLGPTS